MSKEPGTVWKTKEKDGRRMMICQNSNPELSKYPQWGPADGVCDEWSEVGDDTVSLTCWRCATRSVRGIDNDRI
jgi:hypothetical protein